MIRITSILLSFVMLLGCTQVTYAVHSCAGEVIESQFVFGDQLLDCGMASMNNECQDKPGEQDAISRTCCDNQHFSIETDDNFQGAVYLGSKTLDINVQPSFAILTPHDLVKVAFGYSGLSPPIVHNFQVAFQTFLI